MEVREDILYYSLRSSIEEVWETANARFQPPIVEEDIQPEALRISKGYFEGQVSQFPSWSARLKHYSSVETLITAFKPTASAMQHPLKRVMDWLFTTLHEDVEFWPSPSDVRLTLRALLEFVEADRARRMKFLVDFVSAYICTKPTARNGVRR